MTDATKPGPGWYVAASAEGIPRCIEFDGRWWRDDDFLRDELPPGLTLGPRIEDLLRDAAEAKRLREIVNTIVPMAGCFDPDNEEQIEEIGLEWSKRYHAAKRDAERIEWLGSVFNTSGPMAFRAAIDAEIARKKAGRDV